MPKKAQAAMEFLMTYGWAILVVLVVIGALTYFGVLNPGTFMPSRCTTGEIWLTCPDFQFNSATAPSGSIDLTLQNTGQSDIQITNIDIMELPGGFICNIGTSQMIAQGASYTYNAAGTPISCSVVAIDTSRVGGGKIKANMSISWNRLGSQVFHRTTGEIVAQIE